MHLPNGMDLRKALILARRLGLGVRYARGTGEWLIRGPEGFVRHNARRRDASRALVRMLRQSSGERVQKPSTGRDST